MGILLYIEDTRGYGINMFGFQKQENTDLVLYLPEKEYQQLNGNFVSANVTVDTCNTDHLYLKTISGTIFCRERKVRLNRIKYDQWRYFCKPYKNRRVPENGFCKRSCYSNGK